MRTGTTMDVGRDDFGGDARSALRIGMFKSAFNNVFRAGRHALAYQHVTVLVLICQRFLFMSLCRGPAGSTYVFSFAIRSPAQCLEATRRKGTYMSSNVV